MHLNKINILKIQKDWQDILARHLQTKTFTKLIKYLQAEYLNKSKTIYPYSQNIFSAFNNTPLNQVRVVILGQDPYHGNGQAHGLCFSVPEGVKIPPSLRNILKEIDDDVYDQQGPTSLVNTDLTRWAEQGVLLLNSVLTVEADKPGSHANIGWEDFTDTVIKTISDTQENIVFILWGNYARNKKNLINTNKHLILEAPHPSPLSAHRGFFGCRHFSKANEYLEKHKQNKIKW